MHNYILHPSNLRNRDIELEMRIEEGSRGYGIYIMILELMRDANLYRIKNNAKHIAFAINENDVDTVDRIMHTYNLFQIEDDNYIYSKWLRESLEEMDRKAAALSEAGRRGARARANRTKTEEPAQSTEADNILSISTPPISQATATPKPGYSISINKSTNKSINQSTNQMIVCDGGEAVSVEVLDALCRGRDYNLQKKFAPGNMPEDGLEHNMDILTRLTAKYDLTDADKALLCALTNFFQVGGQNLMKLLRIEQRMQQEEFRPKFYGSYILKKLAE